MKLEIQREHLLRPLQNVIGVVERRQTLPVLSNVLVVARGEALTLTSTDLEVELVTTTHIPVESEGEITIPARKLFDILKNLPEESTVHLQLDGDRVMIRCGRSRFVLTTLPAAEFPTLEDVPFEVELNLAQTTLRTMIERTHFAMAQQDVRYYLNGLLLDYAGGELKAVATDGHRLTFCSAEAVASRDEPLAVIVPRKGVQELLRLLGADDEPARLRIGSNHIQVRLGDIRFTSKLIDGKFPDYQRVIPKEGSRVVLADRLVLRTALARAAILSNEKYRGIRLQAENWLLRVQAHNPEQDEAEEEVEINYNGEAFEIGFNVTYLIDALGALPSELIKLSFTDANASCLIQDPESERCKYVVMPMRL